MKISYESEELIREVKQDIAEFGISNKAYIALLLQRRTNNEKDWHKK